MALYDIVSARLERVKTAFREDQHNNSNEDDLDNAIYHFLIKSCFILGDNKPRKNRRNINETGVEEIGDASDEEGSGEDLSEEESEVDEISLAESNSRSPPLSPFGFTPLERNF